MKYVIIFLFLLTGCNHDDEIELRLEMLRDKLCDQSQEIAELKRASKDWHYQCKNTWSGPYMSGYEFCNTCRGKWCFEWVRGK